MIVDEKVIIVSWKEYMEKLMNEENECASPAGDQPIGSLACYRIIPGQAQRVHLCPL